MEHELGVNSSNGNGVALLELGSGHVQLSYPDCTNCHLGHLAHRPDQALPEPNPILNWPSSLPGTARRLLLGDVFTKEEQARQMSDAFRLTNIIDASSTCEGIDSSGPSLP